MKKQEVYVKINSKKEAKQAKAVLKAMGEPISPIFWDGFDPEKISHCNLCFCLQKNWTMGAVPTETEITLKQLIELLVKGEYKPEKIAVKVNNEFEFNELMEHYDSLGYIWINGKKPFEEKYCQPYITFEQEFGEFTTEDFASREDYTIIDYADFAKEKGLALKPTEVEVDFGSGSVSVKCKVIKDRVEFPHRITWLSSDNIEAIHSAMKSLK